MTEVKSRMYCPSDDELMRYKSGNLEKENFQEITEHLVTCNVCPRTILDFLPETEEEWQRLKTSDDETSGESDPLADDFLSPDLIDELEQMRLEVIRLEKKRKNFDEIGLKGLRVGQIWQPKADNIILPTAEGNEYVSDFDLNSFNHFVAIVDATPERCGNYSVIKVMPVDDDLSCAAEDEVIIPAQFNPREEDLMLQVWNEKEMLVENLESCFGDIDEEWVKAEREKNHIASSKGDISVKELFAEFKKNLNDFVYESANVIRQGLITSPVHRYRTKEIAETNYLNFPVQSLRYAEAQRKVAAKAAGASSWTFLEQIKSIFSMFPSPTFVAAEDNALSGWEEDAQTYFDGKLRCKRRKSVEGHNLLLLQSDNAEFANRFVLLGKDESDLTLALLTGNNPVHQGYVSVLNFGEKKSPENFYSNQILNISDLSKISGELIQNSVACVDEASELLAWERLTAAAENEENLSKTIQQAIKERKERQVD